MAIPVKIIYRPTARRLRLRFDCVSGSAVLTAPPRTTASFIARFLDGQRDWLEQQCERALTPLLFVPDMSLELLGQTVFLRHHPKAVEKIAEPDSLIITGSREVFSKRVERALRRHALAQFTRWADEDAGNLGLPPCPVKVRDTRSRWGSCSARSGISLSWRLVFAPVMVARYVVAHEVAHRRHMNHSPAFWATVRQLVGDPSPSRKWLRDHGLELFRYGRDASLLEGVAALPPLAA